MSTTHAEAFAALTRNEVLLAGARVDDVRVDGARVRVRRPVGYTDDLRLHLALPDADAGLRVVHPHVDVVHVAPCPDGWTLDLSFRGLHADEVEALEQHLEAVQRTVAA